MYRSRCTSAQEKRKESSRCVALIDFNSRNQALTYNVILRVCYEGIIHLRGCEGCTGPGALFANHETKAAGVSNEGAT
jgi:hypothetical protein